MITTVSHVSLRYLGHPPPKKNQSSFNILFGPKIVIFKKHIGRTVTQIKKFKNVLKRLKSNDVYCINDRKHYDKHKQEKWKIKK